MRLYLIQCESRDFQVDTAFVTARREVAEFHLPTLARTFCTPQTPYFRMVIRQVEWTEQQISKLLYDWGYRDYIGGVTLTEARMHASQYAYSEWSKAYLEGFTTALSIFECAEQ